MRSIVYLKRSDPTVEAIVRRCFPEFSGRDVRAHITDSVYFHGTQWDEGSKNDYILLRLEDFATIHIEEAPFLQQSELHSKAHTIPPGYVCVEYHRGRVNYVTIHTNAANVTPMLPAPVTLTDDEKIVLAATRSYKSSYAGISNYRFSEANRTSGITIERWNTAKESLINKKFLNKAGAITTEGMNALI